jgi:hypothetical protein
VCYFLLCLSLLRAQHLEYLNPLSMNLVLNEIGASELMAFKALGLFLADIARLDSADDAKSSVRALIQWRVFFVSYSDNVGHRSFGSSFPGSL